MSTVTIRKAYADTRLGQIHYRFVDAPEAAGAPVLFFHRTPVTSASFDRVLATRFGLNAIAAVKDGAWGTMVALQGTDIVRVPLQAATGTLKTVPVARYEEAKAFFG